MKVTYRIALIWSILLLVAVGLTLLPHKDFSLSTIINVTCQSVLMLVCAFLVKNERGKAKKFVFLNFSIFFSLSIISYLGNFIGTVFFTSYKFATHFHYQYYFAVFIFCLGISIIYLVIDNLFNNLRTYSKYLISSAICLTFFLWYFSPMIANPMYLYSKEEIKQWKTLANYTDTYGITSEPEEIAKSINLQVWDGNTPIGDLYPQENIKRIEELLPYIEGDNYIILLNQPLFSNMIYMNVMLIGFILLFFGYQYQKNAEQDAYIDKIMFVILLIASTDILHYWGYIKSVEWNSFYELFSVGQYITSFFMFLLVALFSMRLKYVTASQTVVTKPEVELLPQTVLS